jgi:hypothetical protein
LKNNNTSTNIKILSLAFSPPTLASWTSFDEKSFTAEPTLERKQHLWIAQQFLLNVDLVCSLDTIDNCRRDLLAAANLTHRIVKPGNAGSKKEM